jgi:arylsulfatase A-like enzyme
MSVTNPNRRDFLKLIGLGGAALTLPGHKVFSQRASGKVSSSKPNILFIVADDLGWADVGYHGSPIQTPNLDRLAKQGVRFEQHYVAPMCSPTRAGLLSGRYPSRFGCLAATNSRVFPFGTVTLASALKSGGYDTGITGKWHLGSKPEWGPLKYGFNRSYGSLAGGVTPYTHLYKKGPYSRTWHRNDQLVQEQGHVTDLIAREAIRWIELKRDGPFFIYVPFTAVHIPIDEPERWVELYDGRIENESYKRYAACVTHMDHAIGQMVEALERTGQRKDTLIVFCSDNGSFPGWRPRGRYPGEHRAMPVLGSNRPLRGYKSQLYEGGIRVPAFANWPGTLAPRKVTAPVHIVDWMPTLTHLAGYQAEQDLKWDGRDIWPLLTGEVTKPGPRTLYWKFVRGRSAIRHGDWKLIVRKGKGDELFDLAADPNEKQNLAKTHPDRVARLKELLEREAARDS